MAGAGPPHTVKRPEIVMKRTDQPEPPDTPACSNTIVCLICQRPANEGHQCAGIAPATTGGTR
jgi:hypothetical protein